MDFFVFVEFIAFVKIADCLVPVEGLGARRLPNKIRGDSILRAINRIGQCSWIRKHAIVVVSHRQASRYEQSERDGSPPQENGGSWPIFAAPHPPSQETEDREAKKHAVIRAAGANEYNSDRQQDAVAQPSLPHESGKSSQHKRATKGREGTSARVGVYPVAEEAQPEDGQQSA